MKKIFFLIVCLQALGNIYSQGITLLYKGSISNDWNDPTSWIQLNTPAGETPIQKVPTELDDVVFSKSLSGISSAGFSADQGSQEFNIGGSGTTGKRCRSMHISNTEFYFNQNATVDMAATVNVFTSSGGFVLIDSGANVVHGLFNLNGGNPAITDLTIVNSKYGQLFTHATWSSIEVGSAAKARFINSELQGWFIGGHGNGGEFYAENCSFMDPSFRMAENSTDTLLNCNISIGANFVAVSFSIGLNAHFVSSNVNIISAVLYFNTSGAQLNGNVTTSYQYGDAGFSLTQEDPAHPLPSIINGNLSIDGDNGINIQGGLKISGNLIFNTIPAGIGDTTHVYVNGQQIFRVGGIGSICGQNFCPANIEFFGNTNSNVYWPIGFPVDTLTINKTGCAKVTLTNSLYVSGAANILQGQLVLNPNESIPYKFVCSGDLDIMQGAGIFLRKNETGVVANMAVDGNLIDHNSSVDSACTGLSNPYNGNITLYSNGENAGNRIISISSSNSIGNLNLVGNNGSGFILGSNLTVNNFSFINASDLLLGEHDLIVTGNIEMIPK